MPGTRKGSRRNAAFKFAPGETPVCNDCGTKLVVGLLRENPKSTITPGHWKKADYLCRACRNKRRIDSERRRVELEKMLDEAVADVQEWAKTYKPKPVKASPPRRRRHYSYPPAPTPMERVERAGPKMTMREQMLKLFAAHGCGVTPPPLTGDDLDAALRDELQALDDHFQDVG